MEIEVHPVQETITKEETDSLSLKKCRQCGQTKASSDNYYNIEKGLIPNWLKNLLTRDPKEAERKFRKEYAKIRTNIIKTKTQLSKNVTAAFNGITVSLKALKQTKESIFDLQDKIDEVPLDAEFRERQQTVLDNLTQGLQRSIEGMEDGLRVSKGIFNASRKVFDPRVTDREAQRILDIIEDAKIASDKRFKDKKDAEARQKAQQDFNREQKKPQQQQKPQYRKISNFKPPKFT